VEILTSFQSLTTALFYGCFIGSFLMDETLLKSNKKKDENLSGSFLFILF